MRKNTKVYRRLTQKKIESAIEKYHVKNGIIYRKSTKRAKEGAFSGGYVSNDFNENRYLYATVLGIQLPYHRWVMILERKLTRDNYTDYEVNHKNGNKLDNRLCNLELCTGKDNKLHRAVRNILIQYKVIDEDYKLSVKQAKRFIEEAIEKYQLEEKENKIVQKLKEVV